MTPPADIGKEPPRVFTTTRACSQDRIPDVPVVRASYADYWRRRALAAEGLLREARDYSTRPPASPTCDCDTCKAKRSFPRRVAAALGEAT